MRLFVNILLGLCSVLCAAALILQGFLFPALPGWADLLLRIGVGIFAQILMLRMCQKKLLRYAPSLISTLAAVWGLLLLLSSPSWMNATTGGFFHDYISFLGGCLLVVLLNKARPWIQKLRKRIRRYIKRRRKQKQTKDIPHS